MEPSIARESVRDLLFDFIANVMLLIELMVPIALIVGLVDLIDHVVRWQWYVWLIASPALYVCWLIIFLLLSALTFGTLGKRYPKPRYRVYRPGSTSKSKEDLGLLLAAVGYRRYALLGTLPLLRALEQSAQSKWVKLLVLRAYAPSAHLGEKAANMGIVYDPDLTHIGDHAVIGGSAAISAHSVTIRPGGEVVYVTAPVIVGKRATIGGESRVALGCVIGDDAVVEPGSVVAAFTHIPSAEVWGGNPAQFRREREDDGVHDETHRGIDTEEFIRPETANPVILPTAARFGSIHCSRGSPVGGGCPGSHSE